MPLWLVGMMGSGKSSVGRLVADRAAVSCHDTDEEVAEQAGCSVAELWAAFGEERFRQLEEEAIARLSTLHRAVVATGGGAVLRAANRTTMRSSGLVVWLRADSEVLAGRVSDGAGRPLLANESVRVRLTALAEARAPSYAEAAHLVVNTDQRSLDDVVTEVVRLWTGS